MGEVYRARDTKLGREVAIKILPELFAADPERLARFQREAQVLASLNHPHIAAIYGLERAGEIEALVLELVPGETLAEKIAAGPIPVEEAVAIARQVADALEAAHEKGIVHRDLKPANVKLTPEGKVKVLDFGLAKALTGDASSPDVSHSPTLTAAATQAGVVIGTAAYMSPEQARGKPVDKRSDIWSFGVLLFEMLTGRRLFAGETVSDTLAAVLRQEVDLKELPAETPASIRRLLSRCLERDPRRRLRDIGDARYELDAVEGGSDAGAGSASVVRSGIRPLPALAAMIAVGLAAAGAAWVFKPRPEPQRLPVIRASYPIGARLNLMTQRPQLAISPDGQFVATVVGGGLKVRRVEELVATEVAGTEGVMSPFFSPDSKWIGFTTAAAIKKVPVESGGVSVVVEVGGGVSTGPFGASWGDNGLIYYGARDGLHAVSANGGASQVVVSGSNSAQPQLLPGTRLLLYTRGHSASAFSPDGEVVLRALDGGHEVVLTKGTSPRYASTGHLLVARAAGVFAAPLDLKARRLSKEPVLVTPQVAILGSFAQYDVSRTGTFIWIPGSAANNPLSLLRRIGAAGAAVPLGQTPREYSDPRVSPDGRRIALHLQDQQNDVWTLDIERDSLTRLTFDPREDETPVWSPDSLWIAYSGSARQGDGRRVFRRRADGSGAEETLWSLPEHTHVTDWSPDERTIVLDVLNPVTGSDIRLLDLAPTPKIRPYLETPFDESSGRVSPDGRWLVYRSNESGRNEIYLQPFPTPGAKVQVSTGGGMQPVWSRSGRELYYRSDSALMVARSEPGPSLSLQAPVPLFKDAFARTQGDGHTSYDVFPDGRFVFIESIEETANAIMANPVVIATFNWLQDLSARVSGRPAGASP